MEMRFENRPTWRDYQARLKRNSNLRHFLFRLRWVACAACALMVILLFIKVHPGKPAAPTSVGAGKVKISPLNGPFEIDGIRKDDIRKWLPPGSIANLEKKSFDIQVHEQHFHIDTSLEISLQTLLLKKVRASDAEQMALVVLDPDDGRVLAMVGVDQDHRSANPCIENLYPAASVFKIVTAAAAIEQCNFNPETELTFNGGKYTLYKSQLKDRVNRYTNTISFQDSFAQSVNPVFGKIGAQVGGAFLTKYGRAFGFNSDIDFEVALPISVLEVNDEPYHLAEIACGFNRTTTLTPLHGALIVAAVLNGGQLPQPTLIEQIVDENGQAVYRSLPAMMGKAMSNQASELLEGMMTRTVKSGTCRKTFRNISKDRVLSKLVIGGKTGSIDNRENTRRMDWFVGFAGERNGSQRIVVAVVVGHGKYIGTKAAEFARYTFKNYFRAYFAAAETEKKRDG